MQAQYSEDNKLVQLDHLGTRYIMTENSLTRPLIFNTISASFTRGVIYSIISAVVCLMYSEEYFNLFAVDIILIFGFLYISLWLLHKVMTGKIKKVAVATLSKVKICGVTFPLMWSAFVRPIVATIVLLYNGYTFGEIFDKIVVSFSNPFMYIVGFGIVAITIALLLYPAKSDVLNYHKTIVRSIHNLTAAPAPTQPKKPKVHRPTYKMTTAPPTEHYGPPKTGGTKTPTRTQTSKPTTTTVTKRPVQPVQPTSQLDNNRVNRRRRDI